MAKDHHIYGEVNSKTSLKTIFKEIRQDVAAVRSRPALTELYKRAGYLITLTNAPAWKKKFGTQTSQYRTLAKAEFASTARKINSKAKQIGAEADYDETWGKN